MPYVNTSSFVILDTFSVERTYIMIRTMGLRHLVVVDEHNHVRGIVTRKDMMGDRLDYALERALGGVVSNSGNWTSGGGASHSSPRSRALVPPTLPVTVVSGPGVGAAWSSSSTQDIHHHLLSIERPQAAATLDSD
uniref:CBS domain-containing protein n=1 Tax=Dunaliella tertiolecta TaxID=3047 RepID=A0A7S3QRS0_DUNTE